MRSKSIQKMGPQLDREKALFAYHRALERGDFDTIASILAQAEHDIALTQMITELNEYYSNRSILPFKSPALQGETHMQITEKINRPLPVPQRLRSSFSLFAAVVAASILGIMLFAQLWQPSKSAGPDQGAGASAPASSATPTVIPSPVTFSFAMPQVPGYELINIPEDSSDADARALILKKVEEALQGGVPSTVMVQIFVPGQTPHVVTFFKGNPVNMEFVPNAIATAVSGQGIPMQILTAMPPFENLPTLVPRPIVTPR